MAEKKTQVAKKPVKEKFNESEKVTVKSIAGWIVGFKRAIGDGDISIAPGGSIRLTREEIIAQAQSGNVLFVGRDGKGSHATLIIEDAPTRVELDFEDEEGTYKQDVFSEEKVKALFKENYNLFVEDFKRDIRTRAEKFAVIDTIKKLKINDYDKIRFVEGYTGYKLYD